MVQSEQYGCVGAICYATQSGLGIECKAFFDHGLIDEMYVVPHSHYPTQDWYPNACKSIDELLDKCDTIIAFETFFDWQVIKKARALGKQTILVTHYECTPNPPYYWPDKLIAPSDLDYDTYKDVGLPIIRLNIPVEASWKLRKKAKVFVHNAGHGGLLGRNSTLEVLHAWEMVKSPAQLILRAQNGGYESSDPRITIINGSVPYEDLWKEGDVFILPDKFGGSFLPMQEAWASGLAVMAADRYPTNAWLPRDLLIPVFGYEWKRIGMDFESAIIKASDIAQCIDAVYDTDISAYSKEGKQWAAANSWGILKRKYKEFIQL